MPARSLRTAAAARISPRWVAAGSRLLHGETPLQRALSHRLPWTPAARRRARAEQVTTFSALDTIAGNRELATSALDRAGVPYDAPEPAPMHPARVAVAPAVADRARAALHSLPRVTGPSSVLVFRELAAGDLLLAGPELGCEVRLDGSAAGGPEARIDFPIDVVYTWVDGSDPAWQDRLRARQDGVARHHLAANPSRFLSRDELRYSLRSLEMYAGWVRQVFLVTDQQVPRWLRAGQVTVVDHREIFPADGSALPTFNSHAIEARLHHIPGLADHYLYLNDDVFFGRPVAPETFFTPDGRTHYFPTPAALDDGPPTSADRPVDAAAKVSRQLVERELGASMTMKFQHVAHVQRRDVMAELETRFGAELERTVQQPFRHVDDVSAAASLAHYYGAATGRAVPGRLSYLYCDIAERRAPVKLARLARTRDADMFCLNDVGDSPATTRAERLAHEFLAAYFPLPSRYEDADSG
jgi:stealth protein CR2/Stealth-like protein